MPKVHCGLMMSKNQLSIFFINLNYFSIVLPHGFRYILLSNEMVRCKIKVYTLSVFDIKKEANIRLQPSPTELPRICQGFGSLF